MRKKISSVFGQYACAWLCGVLCLMPALHGVGVHSKRELILYWEGWTYAVIAALSVWLAIIAFRNAKSINRLGRFFAGIAPLAAMLHAFLMLPDMEEWISAVCGLVGYIAAVAVFVRCFGGAPIWGGLGMVYGVILVINGGGLLGTAFLIGLGCIALVLMKDGRLKAFIGALYGTVGTVVTLFLLLGALFILSGFGAEYTSETVDSPDGKCTAQLFFVDEGALGSGQYVLVEEKGAGINVLIGRLKKSQRIYLDELKYVYDWDKDSFVSFEWTDENTLTVDGYSMEVSR